MRYIYLVLFFSFFSFSSKAQHLQLINDQGEVGAFMGYGSYNGDIASDVQFIKMNYGAFYKKQLNAYIGLRVNYEKLNLGASDLSSQNTYDLTRGFIFERDFHEVSVLSELYFNRFITDRKDFRFSPYLGFGVGYLLNGNIDDMNGYASPAKNRIATMPINVGFKWNVYKQINLFGEFKYRFTTSDYVDHFPDDTPLSIPGSANSFQGSKSGKDELMSASIGLSYNFRKIYGPEKFKPSKKKKSDIEDHSPKKRSKLLFFLPFNRK
jgi:hypothetical protein